MSSTEIDDGPHHLVRDAASLTEAQKLDTFVLTPPMVLTAALLYLMLAEGEIGASNNVGSGFVTPLLQSTKTYVNAVPLGRFLQDAPNLLGMKERLSVLVNVRDAMVSDGNIHEAEQEIFDKLTVAFGIKPQALESFLEAITAKNNKASLGDFDGSKLDIQTPSPHVGLAAAVIKAVMAPDGSVATDDLDRLEELLGEYDGLLEFGLEQAPGVSSDQLFETMAETLNREQKLFVLTNVFEAMHKEGDVDSPEKKSVFETMRSALGFTESAFKPIVLALKAKSAKSAATRDQTGAPILQSVRSKFERKPRGFAQANAVKAGVVSSNVVQVGGPSGIVVKGAPHGDADAKTTSFSFNATAISHRAAEIKGKLNISRQEIRSNSARRAHFAKPNANARSRTENRASLRFATAPATAQARQMLEATRLQLDNTRAANAEIRARMDQPFELRDKSKTPGSSMAKATEPHTAKPQASNPKALNLERQMRDRLDQAASLLPGLRTKPTQAQPETPPLSAPSDAINKALTLLGARSAPHQENASPLQRMTPAAQGNALHRVRATDGVVPQTASQKVSALRGAKLSDPDLIGPFAVSALVLVFWMMLPAHGSLWSIWPTAYKLQVPCWLNRSVLEPLQLPNASTACGPSPRLGLGSGWVFASPDAAGPKRAHPQHSAR